jgi:hypothetical protein
MHLSILSYLWELNESPKKVIMDFRFLRNWELLKKKLFEKIEIL